MNPDKRTVVKKFESNLFQLKGVMEEIETEVSSLLMKLSRLRRELRNIEGQFSSMKNHAHQIKSSSENKPMLFVSYYGKVN